MYSLTKVSQKDNFFSVQCKSGEVIQTDSKLLKKTRDLLKTKLTLKFDTLDVVEDLIFVTLKKSIDEAAVTGILAEVQAELNAPPSDETVEVQADNEEDNWNDDPEAEATNWEYEENDDDSASVSSKKTTSTDSTSFSSSATSMSSSSSSASDTKNTGKDNKTKFPTDKKTPKNFWDTLTPQQQADAIKQAQAWEQPRGNVFSDSSALTPEQRTALILADTKVETEEARQQALQRFNQRVAEDIQNEDAALNQATRQKARDKTILDGLIQQTNANYVLNQCWLEPQIWVIRRETDAFKGFDFVLNLSFRFRIDGVNYSNYSKVFLARPEVARLYQATLRIISNVLPEGYLIGFMEDEQQLQINHEVIQTMVAAINITPGTTPIQIQRSQELETLIAKHPSIEYAIKWPLAVLGDNVSILSFIHYMHSTVKEWTYTPSLQHNLAIARLLNQVIVPIAENDEVCDQIFKSRENNSFWGFFLPQALPRVLQNLCLLYLLDAYLTDSQRSEFNNTSASATQQLAGSNLTPARPSAASLSSPLVRSPVHHQQPNHTAQHPFPKPSQRINRNPHPH